MKAEINQEDYIVQNDQKEILKQFLAQPNSIEQLNEMIKKSNHKKTPQKQIASSKNKGVLKKSIQKEPKVVKKQQQKQILNKNNEDLISTETEVIAEKSFVFIRFQPFDVFSHQIMLRDNNYPRLEIKCKISYSVREMTQFLLNKWFVSQTNSYIIKLFPDQKKWLQDLRNGNQKQIKPNVQAFGENYTILDINVGYNYPADQIIPIYYKIIPNEELMVPQKQKQVSFNLKASKKVVADEIPQIQIQPQQKQQKQISKTEIIEEKGIEQSLQEEQEQLPQQIKKRIQTPSIPASLQKDFNLFNSLNKNISSEIKQYSVQLNPENKKTVQPGPDSEINLNSQGFNLNINTLNQNACYSNNNLSQFFSQNLNCKQQSICLQSNSFQNFVFSQKNGNENYNNYQQQYSNNLINNRENTFMNSQNIKNSFQMLPEQKYQEINNESQQISFKNINKKIFSSNNDNESSNSSKIQATGDLNYLQKFVSEKTTGKFDQSKMPFQQIKKLEIKKKTITEISSNNLNNENSIVFLE